MNPFQESCTAQEKWTEGKQTKQPSPVDHIAAALGAGQAIFMLISAKNDVVVGNRPRPDAEKSPDAPMA